MKVSKVIYFDESSVTDYMQIINNGNLKKFTELVDDFAVEGKGEVKAGLEVSSDASTITKLFKVLTGASYNVGANADLGLSKKRDKLVKNILENTILSDFLEEIGKGNEDIEILKGYSISPVPKSFSHLRLAAPYLKILREGESPVIGDNNFTIDISKLESALKEGRGYYEFIGDSEEKKIIIRFNNNTFRNNYTMADIIKMQLVYYAVKVGNTSLDELSFDKEFEFDTDKYDEIQLTDNPDKTRKSNQTYDVYDVLLAGVSRDE